MDEMITKFILSLNAITFTSANDPNSQRAELWKFCGSNQCHDRTFNDDSLVYTFIVYLCIFTEAIVMVFAFLIIHMHYKASLVCGSENPRKTLATCFRSLATFTRWQFEQFQRFVSLLFNLLSLYIFVFPFFSDLYLEISITCSCSRKTK